MAVFQGHRQWVYPAKSAGLFTRIHHGTSALLVAFLVVVPWLRWGGEPLVLLDIGARRFTLLGMMFTATDAFLLLLLTLSAAFALFFATTIFGRLWCGYFCPQSVFMINVVFRVEDWIQGARGVRRRRDSQGWTFDRIWRKAATWAVFAAVAVFVSMSFMGFFARTELLWTGQATVTNYAVVGFFSTIWFLDFAWFREQTCNMVCPYARFQGALTDDESLVISYDIPRGEPRGKAARKRGGCIDCNKCVVVCPQGIDIRDGYQLECIACGKCVDACTSVMNKLGHETLVRYSTEARDQGAPARPVWKRPRFLVYGTVLTALAVGIVTFLLNHQPVELLVDRSPGDLWVEDADGLIRNTFWVSLTDRDVAEGTRTYAIAVDGLPEGAQVRALPIQAVSGEQRKVPLVVRVPRDKAERTVPITVRARGLGGVEVDFKTTFKGPGAPGGE